VNVRLKLICIAALPIVARSTTVVAHVEPLADVVPAPGQRHVRLQRPDLAGVLVAAARQLT
jgi:hypothetical protein